MKSNMKENVRIFIGCFMWLLLAILFFKACDWYSSYKKEKRHDIYMEKRKNDSIRKAFIRDSLAHDPQYQDSIKRETAKQQKWLEEQEEIDMVGIVGYVMSGDSIYHTSFHVIVSSNDHYYGFMVYDRPKLRFVTKNEVKNNQLILCGVCEETEDVQMMYEDGELIREEDVYDNIDEDF